MATFTCTIPDTEAGEVTADLAISFGYPYDVTDPGNAADVQSFVTEKVGSLLTNMVLAIRTQRAQAVALAAAQAPTVPTITVS